jgi:hypothetical protein
MSRIVRTSRPYLSQSLQRQRNADAPRKRNQMNHRIGRSAHRRIGADRVLKRLALQDFGNAQVLVHHATMRRPVSCASTARRESTAGIAAFPGRVSPSDSTMQAIVEAVPMVMQCPADRLMQLSASMNSCCHQAGLHRLAEPPNHCA